MALAVATVWLGLNLIVESIVWKVWMRVELAGWAVIEKALPFPKIP